MFYIVETEDHLDLLSKKVQSGCFVEIILHNDHTHPMINSVSAIYFRSIDSDDKGYLVPVDHMDGINIPITRLQEIISQIGTLYVFDKKKFLYFFKHQNVVDLQLLYSMNTYKDLEFPQKPSTIEWYQHQYPDIEDINCMCSLPLWYQYCENLYWTGVTVLLEFKEFLKDPSWNFYNNTMTRVFFILEHSSQIQIKEEEFIEKYKVEHPQYSISQGTVYTRYNLYNRTSRPTNAFNNVNFVAIPKTKEYRELFIPRNDKFVEIDFDGYHIRLLGELVNYKFSQESIHQQLGRLYFKKDELSPKEYKESKQKTFQILYGGVPEEYKDIEFFKRVSELADKWWKEFQETGVVRDPISKKPFTLQLEDMTSKTKLMNYLIQSIETSRNVSILKQVIIYLYDKKSSLSLYTYDALLIDLDEEEEYVLEEITKLLDNDKFPVKINRSNSLFFE